MTGFQRGRGQVRAAVFLALMTLFSALSLMVGAGPSASASTLGSSFDGSDASPTGDLAAGAVDYPDATGNTDATTYGGGPTNTENAPCPPIQSGTASPKDDLDHFYFGSEGNANGVFAYMAWHRQNTTGTTTIDFELDHNTGAMANCNGVNPARTADDLLITFDFLGSGPYTINISARAWVGTALAGAWGPAVVLSSTDYEASIAADGSFGELVLNVKQAGLLATVGCSSFTTVFPKTRSSSSSFTNSMKDFVAPATGTVSNCGTVKVHKQDDAAAPIEGVAFDLYTSADGKPGAPVAPAITCTTDAAGNCSMTDIPPGDYFVVEHAAPSGHTGAAPQAASVTADGTVSLTFVNDRQPGAVKIIKHDDTGANLDGAQFTLYSGGSAVAGKSCTTAGGTCTISNILPPGDYTVREAKVPTGYTAAADQTVGVGLNETVELTFVNARQPAAVNVVKQDDTGAPLAGAGFTLYSGGSPVAGKSCTTDAAGTCTIDNILPPGDYSVVETTTPAGYDTAPAQSVKLALNQTATLTFVDNRKPIGLSLVKQVEGQHPTAAAPLVVESGKDVTYTATVANTGEVPVTITSLADTLNPDFAAACPQAVGSVLDAGHSFTCTYTSTISDPAHNVASVGAVDGFDRTAAASDEVFVTPIAPAIALAKTGPAAAHVGDVVDYAFAVTNPGDTGLSDVTLTDSRCSSAPTLGKKAGGNQDGVLDPGEAWSYTCPYTVTAADGRSVANTAEVAGTDPLGTTVTSTGAYTFPVLHPAIAIDKTADPVSVSPGGSVTFSYKVTNTGDAVLHDVAVTDDVLGAIGTIAQLAPGESKTLTRTMSIGPDSPITNVGTAAGTDVLGREVKATDTASIAVVLPETIVRTPPPAPAVAPAASPSLPRTGAMLLRELWWALALLGAGLALLLAARRRRRGALDDVR